MLFRSEASRFVATAAFVLVSLTSCGKSELTQTTNAAAESSAISPAGKVATPLKYNGTQPAWGNRAAWTQAVHRIVRARMQDFNHARDVETYCPGYKNATTSQKESCWVFLVAAISKFESAFNAGDSFREPDGNFSIGLMALSPNECPNASTHKSLQSALPNLVCGTNKMASLIRKFGYIDGPESARGASRYWSTLRKPYKRWDPTRKRNLNLGKRDQVIPLVRGYRGMQFPGSAPLGSVRMMMEWDQADANEIDLPRITEEELLENSIERQRD